MALQVGYACCFELLSDTPPGKGISCQLLWTGSGLDMMMHDRVTSVDPADQCLLMYEGKPDPLFTRPLIVAGLWLCTTVQH